MKRASWKLPCVTESHDTMGEQVKHREVAAGELSCTVSEVRNVAGVVLSHLTCTGPTAELNGEGRLPRFDVPVGWYAKTSRGLFVLGEGKDPPRPSAHWYDAPPPGAFTARDVQALSGTPMLVVEPVIGDRTEPTSPISGATQEWSISRKNQHWCVEASGANGGGPDSAMLCFSRNGLSGVSRGQYEGAYSGIRCGDPTPY